MSPPFSEFINSPLYFQFRDVSSDVLLEKIHKGDDEEVVKMLSNTAKE